MTVARLGAPTGERLQICRPKSEFSLASSRHPVWSLSNERGLQMLRVEIGRGTVSVVAPEFVCQCRMLLQGDNAQAFLEAAATGQGRPPPDFQAIPSRTLAQNAVARGGAGRRLFCRRHRVAHRAVLAAIRAARTRARGRTQVAGRTAPSERTVRFAHGQPEGPAPGGCCTLWSTAPPGT